MFRGLLLPVATLALLCERALAQNNFINPPVFGVVHDYSSNPIWHVGTTQNVTWTTTYDPITLVLWQNDNATPIYLINEQPAQTYIQWPVNIAGTFDLDRTNVFFFGLFSVESDGTLGTHFQSHYVNITNTPAPSTTSSTTMSATGTTSSTASATTTSSSSSGGGLSTGASIGIGVGVGLAALLALLAAAFVLLRRRRRNSPGGSYAKAHGTSDSPPPETGYAMQQQQSAAPSQQSKPYGAAATAHEYPAPAAPAYSPYNPEPGQQYVPGGYQHAHPQESKQHGGPAAQAPRLAEAPEGPGGHAAPAELSAAPQNPQELA